MAEEGNNNVSGGGASANFNPELHGKADVTKPTSVRKANIQAVFFNGKGRFVIIAVAGMMFLLGAIGLNGMRSKKLIDDKQASAAVLSTPSDAGLAVETEEEKRMRALRNAEESKEARDAGKPFIATSPLRDPNVSNSAPRTGDDYLVPAEKPPSATSVKQGLAASDSSGLPVDRTAPLSGPVDNQPPARMVSAEEAQLRAKIAERVSKDLDPQIDRALGRSEGYMQPFMTTNYVVPSRQSSTQNQTNTSDKSATSSNAMASHNDKGVLLIDGGTAYYGKLTFGAKSDAGTKYAMGEVLAGPYAGMKVIGKPEFTDEGATVTFDKCSFPGRGVLPCLAVAVTEDTYDLGMADEVDHHVFRRFGSVFVSSLLAGVGKAAQIIGGSTSVVSTAGSSVTTVSQTKPTISQQSRIALGETGVAMGDLVRRDNERLKTSITVNANKPVGIVFLDAVYDKSK